MAMPRPEGKALKIAKKVVPGLEVSKNEAPSVPYRSKADVETIKMEINTNGGKLPKKYR